MIRHKTSYFLAVLVPLALVVSAYGGDAPYSSPWQEGDLIVNMSGEAVTAARADGSDFEYTPNESSAVTILTKLSFVDGWVTQQNPNAVSNLFVTAPGDTDGTLYRINYPSATIDTLNTSIAMNNGGITSDGSKLFINDDSGNIDLYSFSGSLITDNFITGLASGGFGGTNQVHYEDGFIFVATGGTDVQWASSSGGGAAATLTLPALPGNTTEELTGVWAGGGKMVIVANNHDLFGGQIGEVTIMDLDTSGATPLVSSPVLEGTETGGGGFFSGVTVDLAADRIYAGSAGSFGSSFPGEIYLYDIDGNVENDDGLGSLLNVVTGLPDGGSVNVFRVVGGEVPEPTSLALIVAMLGTLGLVRRRRA